MKQLESFFWGIVAALGAVIFQLIFFILFSIYTDPAGKLSLNQFLALPSFIIAIALIEELFKFMILDRRIMLISSNKNFLANVIFMGIGFFAVELALISTRQSTAQLGAIIQIFVLHLGTASLMGYFIATNYLQKFNRAFFSILLAVVFHSAYNLAIMQTGTYFGYLALSFLAVLVLTDSILFTRLEKALAQD